MNKKIVIVVGILLILAGVCVYANTLFEPQKPSEYSIGITYEEAEKTGKPVLALFYADWCRYCLKFMPKYKMLHSLYKDKFSFVMLNVDSEANEKIVEDYALNGFPTVYIIDPKYDNRVLLSNALYMDLGKLRVELDRYLRIRGLLDSAPVE
ncbi:MAG: thioredoxin fold domain-containing protein [Heliobacteriaceae bacterium]|jgi:thiol-disulfide isomerase/thioredoxin|nr:thioredoxin fold domain-containing protein [Heliobacteriaceae bacterium]